MQAAKLMTWPCCKVTFTPRSSRSETEEDQLVFMRCFVERASYDNANRKKKVEEDNLTPFSKRLNCFGS